MFLKRNEIGSEFWNIEKTDKQNGLFDLQTSWFISGRSALTSIIQNIKKTSGFKRVAMPSWCCDSMLVPFINNGIDINFYSVIVKEGKLIQDLSGVNHSDVLFLMDYFGYQSTADYDFDGKIIRDLTHSIFIKRYNDADYYFGSLRKWSGFITGGFAQGICAKRQKQNNEYCQLREQAMLQKSQYVAGVREDKNFLQSFLLAEEMLESEEVFGALHKDIESANTLNVGFIKQRRRENARLLIDELSDFVLFKNLNEDDCPLFVPICLPEEKRNALRKFLIENKIYCPIHWPISKHHILTSEQTKIYQQELSLICDQRYGLEEMWKIIESIKKFFKR